MQTIKNFTQFFGCSNVTGIIVDGETVGINTFAYGRSFKDPNQTVKVRINAVLSDFVYPKNTKNFQDGDIARIKTLGNDKNSAIYNTWFYNYSSDHLVNSIELVDSSDNSYKLTLNKDHFFKDGDKLGVSELKGSTKLGGTVYRVNSARSISIKGSL